MTREKYNEIINKATETASGCPEWNALFELELLKNGLKIVADIDVNDNNDMSPIPVSGLYYSYLYPSFIVEM